MALDADAIETAIEANVSQPKRVKYGTREVEQHSLKDQLELLASVGQDGAAAQPHFGIRNTKLVSPGCG